MVVCVDLLEQYDRPYRYHIDYQTYSYTGTQQFVPSLTTDEHETRYCTTLATTHT